ncbi:MAG: universal stress protein [Bacteriovorax sp.]|jgi:nucleotide-binding universal stress UspA family protein
MKNIVICTDLNQNSIDTLKTLPRNLDLLTFKDATVHFVHVFEIHMYNADIVPVIYPTEVQYPEIEQSTLGILNKLAHDIGIKDDHLKVHCFFSHSREEKISSYLKDVNADLTVVATRGKHGIEGFFSSSLADFLCKYSPCDVLVVRPKKAAL